MLKFNSLEIENVSFRSDKQQQLLKNINIRISKNQCIAIICENDSEKKTFSNIIQKLCAYENGSITINNRFSLNDVSINDWFNIIGVVQKKVKIYPSHVLENIVLDELTVLQKDHAFENIHELILEYGFEPFIESLPQGYERC